MRNSSNLTCPSLMSLICSEVTTLSARCAAEVTSVLLAISAAV